MPDLRDKKSSTKSKWACGQPILYFFWGKHVNGWGSCKVGEFSKHRHSNYTNPRGQIGLQLPSKPQEHIPACEVRLLTASTHIHCDQWWDKTRVFAERIYYIWDLNIRENHLCLSTLPESFKQQRLYDRWANVPVTIKYKMKLLQPLRLYRLSHMPIAILFIQHILLLRVNSLCLTQQIKILTATIATAQPPTSCTSCYLILRLLCSQSWVYTPPAGLTQWQQYPLSLLWLRGKNIKTSAVAKQNRILSVKSSSPFMDICTAGLQ